MLGRMLFGVLITTTMRTQYLRIPQQGFGRVLQAGIPMNLWIGWKRTTCSEAAIVQSVRTRPGKASDCMAATQSDVDNGHNAGSTTPKPGLEPEQVGAAVAAHLAGISEATWWRHHADGKIPRPNKLGGRTLWRVTELREWIAAGCPDRVSWETRPKP